MLGSTISATTTALYAAGAHDKRVFHAATSNTAVVAKEIAVSASDGDDRGRRKKSKVAVMAEPPKLAPW